MEDIYRKEKSNCDWEFFLVFYYSKVPVIGQSQSQMSKLINKSNSR